MSILFRASGNFTQSTFENSAEFPPDGKRRIVVDLRLLVFVDTYAMVALLTILTLNARDGVPIRIRLPRSASARTYLSRMRFFDLLPPEVTFDYEPPHVTERKAARRSLVELSPININEGIHGIDTVCNFIWDQLPRELRESFVAALAEIGENVIHHSDATVGFLAGQRFEARFQGRFPPRVQLVVGDAGIGIRESLAAAHPELKEDTDERAIQEALKEGVTSKPKRHSGVGLSTVCEYADIFDGVVRVRSGTALIVRVRRGQKSRKVPGLPGTIVAVELSSPGNK